MFVDTSAMVATVVEESDAAALTKRLAQAVEPCTSPIGIYEAVAGVARACNVPIWTAETILDRFLERFGIVGALQINAVSFITELD